jgi:hypothetical protein
METPFHVLADEILHQITSMRIEEAAQRIKDQLVRASKPPGVDHRLHLSHNAFREIRLKSTILVCHV